MPSIGVPIAYDLNSGDNIGAKHELSTLDTRQQTRISSYTAFWNSTVVRPNFQAITFAIVERVLFTNDTSEPAAYGVEYSAMVNGTKAKAVARANKEVIVSAGTLQTPQVLMLSVSCFEAPLGRADALGYWTELRIREARHPCCCGERECR